ncbi:DUF397 domain-containing protein [Streptomyces griseocarneus]|nr:DUF397 domain-containing protein [Streptomyces griseocarneus]
MSNEGTWHKSSYSDNIGGSCVEAADCTLSTIPIRDSKNPSPALHIPATTWSSFISGITA